MKRFFAHAFLLLFLVCAAHSFAREIFVQEAFAQQRTAVSSPVNTAAPATAPIDVNRIVHAVAAKETMFRKALNEYIFKRDAVLQQIGQGGQIAGEYHRVSTFAFDDSGKRFERITFFPLPTFPAVQSEDIEDLGGVNQFALEASKVDQYNFKYIGKEHIDELNLYVFDVAPKVMPNPNKTKERFFQGRIWVDDQDLQIVKTRGKGVPENEKKDQRYPVFETYREQIDGRYWFPTYARTDEELVFRSGDTLHVRGLVRYTDYQRGKGTLRVLDDDETPPAQRTSAPTLTPAKKKSKP